MPLDVRDQHDVALGVECPLSVQPPHAAIAAPGDDLVGNDLDHWTGFACDAQTEHRLGERRQTDRVRLIKCSCRPLLHTSSARAATRPSLMTVCTRKLLRSSTRTTSARQPGASEPRSCSR